MNELLFDKYKTQIENDTISMVIDDNFIISSLEAFCIKQNIEIKNDKIEAIYYQSSGEGASGDMSVCCSMGDKGFLLVTFDGSVVDEFGADQIAQNICDLITVIE